MKEQKPKIGKKGGAQRVTNILNEIRKQPIPKEAFEIVEKHDEKSKANPVKKIAKGITDLET